MGSLILHHYLGSPFSEKVRLVLGYKGLSWQSVDVPIMMPKPDVVALTGGYRRTPFLQIGADIYCDSALMCQVIDRLAPHKPLYPASAGGLQHVLSQWADTTLFWAAVPYVLQTGGVSRLLGDDRPEFLKAFVADRAAMTGSRPRMGPVDGVVHLHHDLSWLESTLANAGPFLLGADPCIADFSVAQSIWHLRRADLTTLLQPYARLAAWYERVAAFGHGSATSLSSSEALAVAARSAAWASATVEPGLGFEAGTLVSVAALDYGTDPNEGRLVGLTAFESVIERRDERAGLVHVHFPRIGFQVRARQE